MEVRVWLYIYKEVFVDREVFMKVVFSFFLIFSRSIKSELRSRNLRSCD